MTHSAQVFHPRTLPEKELIRLIWKVDRTDCQSEREMILPKGTAEIIFCMTPGTHFHKGNEQSAQAMYACSINGLNTSPFHLVKGRNQTFIGVQLNVFALRYLFGPPTTEFTDLVVNGFDVCPTLNILHERLLHATSFSEEVNLILEWFRGVSSNHEASIDRMRLFDLHNALNAEELSISTVCSRYNLSKRHLRRLSNDHLGLNMTDFILYSRYIHSLVATHSSSDPLTTVALRSGFYDQSHFIRTFKSFTGISPGDYRRRQSNVVGHLYQTGEAMAV